MNGATVAAHIGKTVKDIVPDSFTVLEPYLRRALQGEAISEVEVTRPPNHQGEADWTASLSYQPAFDEADEVIGISVAVADITENKRIKEALSQIDSRKEDLLNEDKRLPWIMDSEGNSLQASSQWLPIAEFGKAQMRNIGWLEALHPDDVESTMRTMKCALQTGKSIDIEYRVMSLDGGWRWMRSRGSPRFGPSGEIIRRYGSVEDINECRYRDELRKVR
jgi:PAS domain S-box-containing protein